MIHELQVIVGQNPNTTSDLHCTVHYSFLTWPLHSIIFILQTNDLKFSSLSFAPNIYPPMTLLSCVVHARLSRVEPLNFFSMVHVMVSSCMSPLVCIFASHQLAKRRWKEGFSFIMCVTVGMEPQHDSILSLLSFITYGMFVTVQKRFIVKNNMQLGNKIAK